MQKLEGMQYIDFYRVRKAQSIKKRAGRSPQTIRNHSFYEIKISNISIKAL